MFRPLRFAALFLALALPAAARVPQPVLERLKSAGLPADSIAFTVQRASDGVAVASHDARRPMQPASTLKLVTSLVALETLGPVFRGRTEIATAGTIARGVLTGDLVVRGGADVDFDANAFERMLRVVRLMGVREVRGDVILDRGFFTPARPDVGLAPFDEAPEFRYNFVPDALSLNTNLLDIDIVSDDRAVRVAFAPALDRVTLVPTFELIDADCDDWEDGWLVPEVKQEARGAIVVRLHGTFPRDCHAATAIHVIDREVFADRLFRAAWKRLGGTFRGRVRDGTGPADAKALAHHRARPLVEVLHEINKGSDNPIARMVYLALGAKSAEDPALPTAERSERVVRAWLARNGIDAQAMVLENGSGLSRRERVTPDQLAALLHRALKSPWSAEFLASLPIAAVDGGLRTRLHGDTTARRARLKTGTLRNASALAGFVKDVRDESYVVVAMINDDAARKEVARPILDALVEWVAARGFEGTAP